MKFWAKAQLFPLFKISVVIFLLPLNNLYLWEQSTQCNESVGFHDPTISLPKPFFFFFIKTFDLSNNFYFNFHFYKWDFLSQYSWKI